MNQQVRQYQQRQARHGGDPGQRRLVARPALRDVRDEYLRKAERQRAQHGKRANQRPRGAQSLQ